VKAYILTDADFERLKLKLREDPKLALSLPLDDPRARNAWDTAQRHFVYWIHDWISEVQK
jgi:hypothetical protein